MDISDPRQFWIDFLKPTRLKIIALIMLPMIVALIVTRNFDNVFDFYSYLVTPLMGRWTGYEIIFEFNKYVLLWIPFYLVSCIFVYILKWIRA